MAANSTSWQPQGQGITEICGLLEQQISPVSTSEKSQIWQQLQHYSQFPDFNNYLVFILTHAEVKPVEVRQAAGLLLKNNLRNAFKAMAPANQQYIKSELLPCLGSPDKNIRSTGGTIISVIVQLVGVIGWPELLRALITFLDSGDANHVEGAMDALSKICEDVPQLLDSDVPGMSERPINIFLPKLFEFFQSPHVLLRKLALNSVNQYIMLMPAYLCNSMDQYLRGLFLLSNDSAPEVRKLVCSAFVQLVEVKPAVLEPHLRNLIEYMLQVNKDADEEVALEACEFWSAYCDAQLPPEKLREFLPHLIPVLLSNMVYADDDESIAEAEEDESVPDREQDLKPRFHSSRLHGSDEVEDDDDVVNVWNLRKCSAAGLDILSNMFGDEILPTIMPLIQVVHCPVVILLYSLHRNNAATCSYLKAVGRGLLGLVLGALVVAAVAISLGAPVGTKYLRRTLYWSLLMSLLTFAPVAAVFGSSWIDWQRLFANTRPTGPVDFMVCLPAHGAILGAWFGAWPMPLDWERPWQEWPICVTYGMLVGYTVGMLASIIFVFVSTRKQHTKNE